MSADKRAGVVAEGHPLPLLRRDEWWSLDGTWDFAFDRQGVWEHPADVHWDRSIVVPFAPETPSSTIGDTGYTLACWYRCEMPSLAVADRQRALLHFGAVDFTATVWIDGQLVATHEGGYTAFVVDVTRMMSEPGKHQLVVRAHDDPLDLAKPRGKQDWEVEPHSIWYHRTTGIWQSVWMEVVAATRVDRVNWHTDLSCLEVTAEIDITGPITESMTLRIRLTAGPRELVDDCVTIHEGRSHVSRGFRLDASGLDHLRESLLWTPERPILVEALLEMCDATDRLVDRVYSYTAIRTVGVKSGKFLLNGRPQSLRLVLDQGYWPESGLTPPDDAALRQDVELIKAMGFNGVRMHQKIEDQRFLYWADKLGLLVWVEMPPAYQFDAKAVRRVTDEWIQVVENLRSHPCIVAWVPFNESTGVLDLPNREDERNWVKALTALTAALDPTRPVVSNDGWETVGGDVIAVHDYEQRPDELAARWSGDLRDPVTGYGAHRRLQTLDEVADDWSGGRPVRPIVLTEFGGIGWAEGAPVRREDPLDEDVSHDRVGQPAGWGYSTVSGAEELEQLFGDLMRAVHSIPGLAGFCYTQFCDTYQEINGLLTADRRPKIPIDVIARATRGPGKSFHDPFQGFPT